MQMRRILSFLIVGAACAAVASCGKHGSGSKDDTDLQAVEQVVKGSPKFLNGPTLFVESDAYRAAEQLNALGGVDPSRIYGAAYAPNYPPCTTRLSDVRGAASFSGYGFAPGVVRQWLHNEGYVQTMRYQIRYPNASMPQSYGNTKTFYCPVRTVAFQAALQKANWNGNIHNSVSVPIARRIFGAWTYKNQYSTPMPGQGNVKVFAGRLTYRMKPLLAGLSFTGMGTASVKAHLNPDTGNWVIDAFNAHDPRLTLETH